MVRGGKLSLAGSVGQEFRAAEGAVQQPGAISTRGLQQIPGPKHWLPLGQINPAQDSLLQSPSRFAKAAEAGACPGRARRARARRLGSEAQPWGRPCQCQGSQSDLSEPGDFSQVSSSDYLQKPQRLQRPHNGSKAASDNAQTIGEPEAGVALTWPGLAAPGRTDASLHPKAKGLRTSLGPGGRRPRWDKGQAGAARRTQPCGCDTKAKGAPRRCPLFSRQLSAKWRRVICMTFQ